MPPRAISAGSAEHRKEYRYSELQIKIYIRNYNKHVNLQNPLALSQEICYNIYSVKSVDFKTSDKL